MDPGMVGGIIGGTLGSGAIGTYCSIHNTQNAREKAFVVRASVFAWVGIIAFFALMFTLPAAYRLWL